MEACYLLLALCVLSNFFKIYFSLFSCIPNFSLICFCMPSNKLIMSGTIFALLGLSFEYRIGPEPLGKFIILEDENVTR